MKGQHLLVDLNALGRHSFRASNPVDDGLRPPRDTGAGDLDEDEAE
ncbi:hypothetical protein [Streptomyces rhizosphaerihabitans]|nr:hypothetical protein [Streptomyces rhizosphaerihabitans]MCT9009182.1 hypothetical protein [Streptomyces rhizosphaerihabitans]